MTAMQIYWLVVPFPLMGLAWLAAWWNHWDNERYLKKAESKPANAAE